MAFIKFLMPIFIFFTAQAKYESLQIDNYKDIQNLIYEETKKFSPDELFIIFDLDDTVIQSIDCLGEMPNLKAFLRFEVTVKNCFAQLTSPEVPLLISTLQNNNYPVMALTARRDAILEKTLGQLDEKLILSESKPIPQKISFMTAPEYSDDIIRISFKQPGKKKVYDKELVIKKGVAFCSSANKGLALQAFRKTIGPKYKYKKMIFIDDSLRNIRHLEKAYAQHPDDILILHYTEHNKD